MEIFSSDTSEWKQLIVHCEGLQHVVDVTMFQTHPILAHNDVMHWVNHYSGKILACDPNDEHGKCRLIDLPNDPDGMYQHKCLSMCQGRLQCLIICEEVCQHMIHRWEFLEDEDYIAGKWSLVARIPLCKSNQLLRVIAIHPVDPMILYLWKSKRIVMLNGHTEETDVVHYFAEDQFGCYDAMINAFQFVLQWWPTPVPELHKGTLNTYILLKKCLLLYIERSDYTQVYKQLKSWVKYMIFKLKIVSSCPLTLMCNKYLLYEIKFYKDGV